MATHLEALRTQARTLPEAPGVYFWKDGRNTTLYIGKAVNLRARVTSYFSHARHDRRTRELLERSRTIQYEVVNTELEALFRESALIKQVQPRFNRALRTSRPAYYLKLDSALEDPYLEIAREVEDDGSLYFGPFRSATILRETVSFVHDVLPLRKCVAQQPKCRPCLYYQMHKCAAPLLDEEHRRQHREAINRLYDLLDGRSDRVTTWLVQKRERLSQSLLYEQAGAIQQRLDALAELTRRQAILEAAVQCRCVVVHEAESANAAARLLLVAHGHVVSTRPVAALGLDDAVRWVRAHAPVIRLLAQQQAQLDAACVLERWLVTKRGQVRWVAIPHDVAEEDLRDRVVSVLGDAVADASSARPGAAAGPDAATD